MQRAQEKCDGWCCLNHLNHLHSYTGLGGGMMAQPSFFKRAVRKGAVVTLQSERYTSVTEYISPLTDDN